MCSLFSFGQSDQVAFKLTMLPPMGTNVCSETMNLDSEAKYWVVHKLRQPFFFDNF